MAPTRTNHIKRPSNPFICYRSWIIKTGVSARTFGCSQKELSKIIGKMWNELPAEEKAPHIDKARQEAADHKLRYPDYKFTPKKMKRLSKTSPNDRKREGKSAALATSTSASSSLSPSPPEPSASGSVSPLADSPSALDDGPGSSSSSSSSSSTLYTPVHSGYTSYFGAPETSTAIPYLPFRPDIVSAHAPFVLGPWDSSCPPLDAGFCNFGVAWGHALAAGAPPFVSAHTTSDSSAPRWQEPQYVGGPAGYLPPPLMSGFVFPPFVAPQDAGPAVDAPSLASSAAATPFQCDDDLSSYIDPALLEDLPSDPFVDLPPESVWPKELEGQGLGW